MFVCYIFYRTREQLELSKPKPSDASKPKKPSPPPPKTSPTEETKAPPGFGGQPPRTAASTAHFAILSGGQKYEGRSTFDPYGAVPDVHVPSETLNPVPHDSSSRLVSGVSISSSRSEPSHVVNPPPGFDLAKNTFTLQQVEETEWPDLSGAEPNLLPPKPPPLVGNVSAAVMNTNKQPILLSESSFPTLAGPPPATTTTTSSSSSSWPPLSHTQSSAPPSERSKLLKSAVAATSTSGHGIDPGSAPSYKAATQLDTVELSSQNFPPMSSAPVIVSGSDVLSGNQNNYVPSEDKSTSTTDVSVKKSKQSQMIEKVRKAFDYDKEKFTRFKTLMGWYKNGEITVAEFKAQSSLLFGNKWREIGPEIAEMMPNHEKKNELLSSFGIRSGGGKRATSSAKSRRCVPVTTPSVWGTGPAVPVRNFNTMSTGLSHDEYPTLGQSGVKLSLNPPLGM